jgi:hypothetical protein
LFLDADAEIDIKPNRRHRANDEITAELFWQRIMKPVGCWLYTGAKESNGYGYLQNPFGDKPKFLTAHRAAWIYANGPIPEGMLVLHRCDVRSCINPEHLFLGTHSENATDKAVKGRAGAVITPEQVREVRRLTADGWSGYAIYRKLKIPCASVYRIRKGLIFKHVE